MKHVKKLVEGQGKRKIGIVMGIDAHRSILACCVVDQSEIMFECNFNNNKEGIKKILSVIKKYEVTSTAFESTSVYHLKLMFGLIDNGHNILLANPIQTRTTQGKKTDKIDARRIAVAHRDGRLKPSVISPRSFMQLRRSMRTMFRLINDQTKCKQRLNQLFHQFDFDLHKTEKSFLKSKWSLDLLHECLSLLKEQYNDKMILDLVEKFCPKRGKNVGERIIVIYQALSSLVSQLVPLPLDRYSFITELSQLRLFKLLIDQQRLVYLTYANENPDFARKMRLLLSIPGIGEDTAAVILSELVDINYFKSSSKLSKWTGLAPRVYQSGHRKRVTGKIHKGGNKYLRRAMTLTCAGIYATTRDTNPLYQFIKAKYEEKESFWLAICAASRKLLGIIWILLKKDVEFELSTNTDQSTVEKVDKMVMTKIHIHKKSILRLEEAQQKLSWAIDQQLNLSFGGVKDPKRALRILLKVT